MVNTDLILGLAGLAFVFLLGAIAGALGMATTALIVAGGAHLIGFITMGTAQALAIWMVAGGALLGGIWWAFWTLAVAEGS